MKTIKHKKQLDNKKTIDSAVARATGAVQVAGVAVSKAVAIKNQAIDEVAGLKTESNVNAGDHAVKKISTNSKRVLGVRKK